MNVTTLPGLPGDYNGDGKVDAADYVAWRKGASPSPNSIGDYNTWRTNFGTGAGSGSSGLVGGNVPEPNAVALMMFGLLSLVALRRCQPSR